MILKRFYGALSFETITRAADFFKIDYQAAEVRELSASLASGELPFSAIDPLARYWLGAGIVGRTYSRDGRCADLKRGSDRLSCFASQTEV